MNILSDALLLRNRGFSVVPVHSPNMANPLGIAPDQAGKIPLIPWKPFQQRYPTENEVREWSQRWPTSNLGVITGSISKVFVVDIDGYEGIASLNGRSLPHTPRSSTGRGIHVWLKHPGIFVPNLVKVLPGVDIRGDGGLVVAPPSIHHTGKPYQWIHCTDIPFAEAPSWVLDLIAKCGLPQAPSATPAGSEFVLEGSRNAFLYRIGRGLAAKGLSPKTVQVALGTENLERCLPPLPQAEVEVIAGKVIRQPHRQGFEPQNALPNAFLPPKGGNGKETNFAPISAAELLSQPPVEIEWVWGHYLPRGTLVLFVAFMKIGKTTLIYFLLVAIAQGRSFLGYTTEKCGVLILAVEENPRDVRLRLEANGLQPQDPLYVHACRLTHGDATITALRDFITQNDIGIIVLDTVSRYWDVRDENDNAAVVREVSPLLDLAHETGCIVVLVHHENKSGGEDGRSIRGASSLFGLADQTLLLEKRLGGNDNQRTLKAKGRYAAYSPSEIIMELVDDEYVNHGTSESLDREAAKVKILEVLGTEPRDVQSIVAETSLSRKLVDRALKDLGSDVSREGKGVKGDPYTYRKA